MSEKTNFSMFCNHLLELGKKDILMKLHPKAHRNLLGKSQTHNWTWHEGWVCIPPALKTLPKHRSRKAGVGHWLGLAAGLQQDSFPWATQEALKPSSIFLIENHPKDKKFSAKINTLGLWKDIQVHNSDLISRLTLLPCQPPLWHHSLVLG